MRVALFGGTFDPPHRGHLHVAKAAADAFRLDSVLFAPVGIQPLKAGRAITSFADRLAMVELACAADPRFHTSTIDAPQPDGRPNYTADTLASLRQLQPTATLFNLVGADSFLSLRQWHQSERLLTLAEWIVATRPGFSLNDLPKLHLTEAERSHVHLMPTVHENVSATELRRRLVAREDLTDLVSPAVVQYIHRHGLYLPAQRMGPVRRPSQQS